MKLFALIYEFGPDYMEARAPYKDGHFAHLMSADARGEVMMAGAMMDGPPLTSMCILQAEDAANVEAYAKADPYVSGGVAKSWRVREWFGVIGPGAPKKA